MKKRGISLIVLIITIIVVVILAAVVILTLSKNNPIESAKEAKILSSLHNVNDSIEFYKSKLQMSRLMDDINVDTLIDDGVLKEYIIEETLRPIAVIEDYKKLGINGKFGLGYKNIPEETFEGEVSVKKENLNDVCAIDLTDYTLYYIQDEKVYSLNGVSISDNILSNFERYDADISEWTFDANTQTLTRYNGDLTQKRGEQEVGEVIIPNYYNGKRVKNIGKFLFNGNTLILKVVISKGIEVIENSSFSGCTNLKGDLIIPDSVTSIGNNVFTSCSSLDGKLVLSKNLSIIPDHAFWGCSKLKGDLIIPDSIISIEAHAFQYLSSMDGEIVLSKNLQSIKTCAFYGDSNLKGNIDLSNNITVLEFGIFYSCSSLNGTLKIGNNVTTISNEAFYNCKNLKGNLIIPNSVTSIGSNAFYNCSSFDGVIRIGDNVKTINNSAFSDCSKLKGDLIIPDNITSIGTHSLQYLSSLDGNLVLSKNLQNIGSCAFYGNPNMKGNIILPQTITSLNDQFQGCNKIESMTFYNSNIELKDNSYIIPSNVKIFCYKDSTAEAFAIKYRRVYEYIV